jgi:hypothetical protein
LGGDEGLRRPKGFALWNPKLLQIASSATRKIISSKLKRAGRYPGPFQFLSLLGRIAKVILDLHLWENLLS